MARARARATALVLALLTAAAGSVGAPSPCYDALSLGGFHGLALSRGSVTGFGEGAAGQLDVPASIAGLTTSVAAGGFFSCALHMVPGSSVNATRVSCWGGSGNSAVTAIPPVVASDGGVRALAAGGYHACAVLGNRSVVCWGANGAGQISPLPNTVLVNGVTSLALGAYHSCAIAGGGAGVACWGRDDFGQVSGVPASLARSASSMLRLACGGYHCCGWAAGGAGSNVSCWGAAAAGQTTVPAAVAAASNVSTACAGGYFSCAVVSGSTVCWGGNTRGETTVPAGARDGSVAAVACGWYGACALKLDGSFVCWGGDLGVQAAAASGGQDVVIATADAAGSASGSVLIASGAVAAGAGSSGASGTISIVTGAVAGGNASASSGAIVVTTGAATSGGRRGAISLLAPVVSVEQSLVLAGNLTVGATTLTAADVQVLLALLRGGGATSSASPSAAPASPSATTPTGWFVTTLAGSGTASYADGQGIAAAFSRPTGIAADSLGAVYLADANNNRIRKVSPSGAVATVAGNGTRAFADAQGTAAAFSGPIGVAIDAFGTLYVADTGNNRIRKISAAGAVTTLAGSGTQGYADGQGVAAAFYSPTGVAVDAAGNVYVADNGNSCVRKISPSGAVTTLAGNGTAAYADGQGTAAAFWYPYAVVVDGAGAVYVADTGSNRIRVISASGAVTTLAGNGTAAYADGQGTAAAFNSPQGVAVDAAGNVYVADRSNHRIRKISWSGVVSTIAGADYPGYADGLGLAAAAFNYPTGIVVDASSGVLFVSDQQNQRIRKLSPPSVAAVSAGASATALATSSATVTPTPTPSVSGAATASGTSSATPTATLASPSASVTATATASVGAAAFWSVATLAGGNGSVAYADGQGTAAGFATPIGLAVDASGTVYVAEFSGRIRKISATGAVTTLAGNGNAAYADGQGGSAAFKTPQGVAVDSSGNVYVADYGNHRIRKISPSGAVTTFAGNGTQAFADGQGTATAFNNPQGIAVDTVTGSIYVADTSNHRIRVISPSGAVTTLAGSGAQAFADGQGVAASFANPFGVFVSSGNVYVADYGNHRIRKISPSGAVTTLAGSGSRGIADGQGTAAAFSFPAGVAVDASGNVYVTDSFNHLIRKVNATGAVTTIAGIGSAGFADGLGPAAAFSTPYGITIDASGFVYVADYNNRIRKLTPPAATLFSALPSPAATASRSATPSPSASATPSATPSASPPPAWNVSTVAGNGTAGGVDGQGTAATFNGPTGVAVDSSGTLYVAEYMGNRIRKISPSGVVTTLAGSGNAAATDGQGTAAAFYFPAGVALDAAGNVYVADYSNNRIRVISASGAVTTLAGTVVGGYADGQGTTASFKNPTSVALDAAGFVYVADWANNRIRKVSPSGTVTTFAGNGTAAFADGQGTAAAFNQPYGIVLDASGVVYVCEAGSHRIRKISPSGAVTTLAGSGSRGNADGQGTAASFSGPTGIAVDASGVVYVADYGSQRIRKVSPSGAVTTIAGSGSQSFADGLGPVAAFNAPFGVAVDASGVVYVADWSNHRIRRVSPPAAPSASATASPVPAAAAITPTPGASATSTTAMAEAGWAVTTLAGSSSAAFADGQGTAAAFKSPSYLAIDASGTLYVTDFNNQRIRKISATGAVTTFAGGNASYTYADGQGTSAAFNGPTGIALDSAGVIYVTEMSGNRIRKISSSGAVTTLAGNGTAAYADGQGTAAAFSHPVGVAVDASGTLYVADTSNNRIRKISPSGAVTTFAGNGTAGYADGQGTAAAFIYPYGIALDASGTLYVADYGNSRIRKISPSGVVTTLAGNGTAGAADGQGTAATLKYPFGVSVDSSGVVYVADSGNNRIRKISPTGAVTTLAGNGTAAYADGLGTVAAFSSPYGVAVDASGTLYVADTGNNRIRVMSALAAPSPSAAPSPAPITATPAPGASASPATVWDVSTLAGSGNASYADGQGVAAAFSGPVFVAVDGAGNVYVADTNNQRIRKISPSGAVTTLAGNGTQTFADGQGTSAAFSAPGGVAVDLTTGVLYVGDFRNNRIRKISSSGAVTTLAGNGTAAYVDGLGAAAAFSGPASVALDAAGNVYVADSGNHAIRKVSATGAVTTLAGNGTRGFADGQGSAATFNVPYGLAVDTLSGNVYVADLLNQRIRKIGPGGAVTTLAGSGAAAYADGQGTAAAFSNPFGLAIDASTGTLYVADSGNNRIRKISASGAVSTLAGNGSAAYTDGLGPAAAFANPYGVALDAASGVLYVTDTSNNRIRKISALAAPSTSAASSPAPPTPATATPAPGASASPATV